YAFGILAGLVMSAYRVEAMGRQSDAPSNESRTGGQRGSPANPNPAFSPPRFGNDNSVATPAPAAPVEYPATVSTPENRPMKKGTPASVTPSPAPTPSVPTYQQLPA